MIAACAVLAGCGGSDEPEGEPLPREAVADLVNRLDEIERRYDAAVEDGNIGACEDIQDDSLPAIRTRISQLPEDVDPDLRIALEQSFDRLEELTEVACADVDPPETETESAPPPAPEPPPVETVPPAETEPAPEPKPKKEKEEKDNGNGPDQAPSEGGGSPAPESG